MADERLAEIQEFINLGQLPAQAEIMVPRFTPQQRLDWLEERAEERMAKALVPEENS